MKKVIIIIALIAGVLAFQAIRPESGLIEKATADTIDVNPNGSSELSLLMRDMQKYTNQAKADLKAGKSPAPFPAAFNKLFTAKISENNTKSDFYNQFGELYISSVKNYASSTAENRIETYNNMVNACLACHSQHCPGPVPVIKKMKVE